MMVDRTLRFALCTCAALLLAAPAWSISDLSEDICQDPTDAAESVMEHYDDAPNRIDTDGLGFEEKDCARLCKAMTKLCTATAKSDGKCIKGGDKFTHKLAAALCEDKECKAGVKAEQKADKEDLKAILDEAGGNCDELGDACMTECLDGEVFPLEL